jgi:GNAT superfamily N-acetyltransferase
MSSITRATAADAAAIAALLAAAFAEYRPFYSEGGYAATTPRADVIAQRIGEAPAWVFRDYVVAGTISALVRDDDLYLRSMAVHPLVRRKHIGAQLLEVAESFARDHGCRDLVLSTTPFLDRAIALYRRSGFVRTAEPPHDLFGTPLFTMRKRLWGHIVNR